MTKIVYTSDMHGNEAQFRAFVDHVLEVQTSSRYNRRRASTKRR
nr:hypothetical protein [uncultured archaeon]